LAEELLLETIFSDSRMGWYVGAAEAEKVLDNLDELGRGRLDVVGKSVELFYGDVRGLILRVCRGLGRRCGRGSGS